MRTLHLLASEGRALALAPILIAASFVLTVYADSGDTLDALSRPLLVAAGAALAVQVVLFGLTRNLVRASVAVSLAVAGLIDVRFVALGVLIGVLHMLGVWQRINAQAVAIVPVILFGLALVRVVTSEQFVVDDLFPGNTIPASETSQLTNAPSIYLILMDGYPRADTLASYGLDNSPFLGQLTERGFDVASQSRGNYPFTAQVITAMLNMAHLPDIGALTPAPSTESGQARAIANAIRFNPALEFLERRGYRTLSTGLPATASTLRGVDEYIDPGVVTNFEHQILRRTAVWEWLDRAWVLPQLQSQVTQTFQTVEEVAEADDTVPLFLFAHVMSPHTPFVFDREGNIPDLSCDPGCERWTIYRERIPLPEDEYEAAYAEQVLYVNQLALSAVDAIINASPDAVVILLSDHGARADPSQDEEWYRTFLAARTPGHQQLFPDTAGALSVFPRLFGAYFGEQLPIPADKIYHAHPDLGLQFPLQVTPAEDGQEPAD